MLYSTVQYNISQICMVPRWLQAGATEVMWKNKKYKKVKVVPYSVWTVAC